MCNTSQQALDEALAAKNAGNMPRFADFTKILIDEFDYTVDQIRRELRDLASEPPISSVITTPDPVAA